MSGHSHFATIRRQKEAKDAVKGKIFSRHSKALAIAIKEGGGPDPELNSKLRFAIEQAKADNMPKANIDRVLERASEVKDITEINYEGFGPEGVNIIVSVATDNKNRTSQEIKNLFEKYGGTMGSPGSVSFNFEKKGLLMVKKTDDPETEMLTLIDMGVDDVNEGEISIEAYTSYEKLAEIREKLIASGFEVASFQIVMKPKTFVEVTNSEKAQKIVRLLDAFEEHDDVMAVYSNLDVPESITADL